MHSTGHIATRRRIAVLSILALALATVPAAHAVTDGSSSTAEVTNTAPTVATPKLYTSDPTATATNTCPADGALGSFDPTAAESVTIYVCAVVTDDNGYLDVCDDDVDVSRAFDVSTATPTVIKDDFVLACEEGSGTDVAVTGSFTMEYWRLPGLAAEGNPYDVTVTVTDVEGAPGTGSANFDWTKLTSIDAPATITLGTAGQSGTTTATAATIANTANEAFTITVQGGDLTGSTHAQTIGVANVEWATTELGSYTPLTTSAVSTAAQVAVATSDAGSTNEIWFQLNVPSGADQWIPKDTYAGTITFGTV